MVELSETTDYDPRYGRAQTVAGAKARYVTQDGYTLANFERDVERILSEGDHPDRNRPVLEGQRVF